MILSGEEIMLAVRQGDILFSDVMSHAIGPNSVDLHLGGEVYKKLTDTDLVLNSEGRYELKGTYVTMPFEDDVPVMLFPNTLYLFSTLESTISRKYVPMIEGCSSLARCGVSIHETAGFGDFGWGYDKNLENPTRPTWTLEVSVKVPTPVTKGMRIAQAFFCEMKGSNEIRYGVTGRYNLQRNAQGTILKD